LLSSEALLAGEVRPQILFDQMHFFARRVAPATKQKAVQPPKETRGAFAMLEKPPPLSRKDDCCFASHSYFRFRSLL
jgi:hypothetical protein